MKSLPIAAASALLATVLCVLGCHWSGMPTADLRIAALVAGGVSMTAAVGASLLAKAQRRFA